MVTGDLVEAELLGGEEAAVADEEEAVTVINHERLANAEGPHRVRYTLNIMRAPRIRGVRPTLEVGSIRTRISASLLLGTVRQLHGTDALRVQNKHVGDLSVGVAAGQLGNVGIAPPRSRGHLAARRLDRVMQLVGSHVASRSVMAPR